MVRSGRRRMRAGHLARDFQHNYFVDLASYLSRAARTGFAALLWMMAAALPGFSGSATAQTPSMLDEPATQITAGGGHTCALTTAGAVKCWGRNDFGQLGDNSAANRLTPVAVTGLSTGVAVITAGNVHTCALTTVGAVKCWGYNVDGQLGNGTNTDSSAPVNVTGLGSGVVAITAGNDHTCALTTVGAVKCWGSSAFGQLGDNSTTSSTVPVAVTGIGSGITAISANGLHTCAVTTAGGVKCWGYNGDGQLGDNSNTNRLTPVAVIGLGGTAAAISVGRTHSCALSIAGGMKCWGGNGRGQLGDNSTTQRFTPIDVVGLSSGVAAISAGGFHTCALTTTGGMKCWGSSGEGQLGEGNGSGPTPIDGPPDRSIPVNVEGLGSGVAAISAGLVHTCALTTTGGVKCWGWNADGELGDNSTTRRLTQVEVNSFGHGVAAISAGTFHTCALTTAGGVKCWGQNNFGQLGNGSNTSSAIPVAVTGLGSGVATISAGQYHTCAVTNTGGVKCWGWNGYGQLGDGSQSSRPTPVSISSLTGGVAGVSAGGHHTCARSTGGGVKCWGRNDFGQLGDGTTTLRLAPVNVSGGLVVNVSSISAGLDHTCALTAAGAVRCWGSNSNGQLGNGTTTNSATPINLGAGIAAITTGARHSCALSPDGIVLCWGYNIFGQLGDNSTTQRLTPVVITTSGVAAISAGYYNTCALTNGGGARCWGNNDYGQIGDGTTTQRPTPTNVTGLGSGMAAVSAGGNYTCALATTGGLKCWGVNDNGQLGDNSLSNRSVPVDIRRSQSISFTPPAIAASGATLTLTATASSVLTPVTFDTWTPTTCTVTGGTTLNLTGAPGSLCGVRASQSGAAPLPAGGSVAPAPQQLRLIQIPLPPTLDIDDSAPTSQYDAASDGVLLIRYLLGYRDNALITGAISVNAPRNATQIAQHIAGNLTRFDVDGDGLTLATTDGVMILRRLLGITNAAAITQGVKNSIRSDADVVLAIDALKP